MIAIQKPTRPRRIVAAENRARAVKLRKAGHKLEDIANELGVTPSRIVQYVQESLEEINADRREEHNEWFDHDWAATTAMLDACLPEAVKGNLGAIDTAVKVLARRAKMRGFDEADRIGGDEDAIRTYDRAELKKIVLEGFQRLGMQVIDSTATPTGEQ